MSADYVYYSYKHKILTLEEYRKYCLSKKGVTESFPFSNLPNTLVFKVAGKMFTATNIDTFASFSIKCNPETIDELREQYQSLQEASYFSKKHWSKVIVDNSIPDNLLYDWLGNSYNLVVSSLPKRTRFELE